MLYEQLGQLSAAGCAPGGEAEIGYIVSIARQTRGRPEIGLLLRLVKSETFDHRSPF